MKLKKPLTATNSGLLVTSGQRKTKKQTLSHLIGLLVNILVQYNHPSEC